MLFYGKMLDFTKANLTDPVSHWFNFQGSRFSQKIGPFLRISWGCADLTDTGKKRHRATKRV
jgi:hypothetical protein